MKKSAIVLSGGNGTRMGTTEVPKQYLKIRNKPIIAYCLETLQDSDFVDEILIVANFKWKGIIQNIVHDYSISKFIGVAPNGDSRQASILNGLNYFKELGYSDDSIVLIHDAARPFLTKKLIEDSLNFSTDLFDGCLPVLPVTDTIYQSVDGTYITNLLNRDTLFAGQSPESFILGKYLNCHSNLDKNALENIKGSSEIAFSNDLKIKLINGDVINFKVTTFEDLLKFETLLGKKINESLEFK